MFTRGERVFTCNENDFARPPQLSILPGQMCPAGELHGYLKHPRDTTT